MIAGDLEKLGYQILIREEESDNGYCLCLVEEDGERTFITVKGAEGASGPPGLNSCPRMPTTASMWPDTRCAVPAAGSFPIGWRARRTG